MTEPRSDHGFSLVETLIAAAIIAVTLASLFQTLSANATAVRAMENRRQAVLVARSVLDMVVADRGAPQAGTQAGMAWRATVEPYAAGPDRGGRLELVSVFVATPDSEKSLVHLRTLRLRR